MLKGLLIATIATIGGIYLTSDEGKSTRQALMRKKVIFEPIIKNLFNQTMALLEESSEVKVTEVRETVKTLMKEVQTTLAEIDFDKSITIIREALQVVAKKIQQATDEVNNSNFKSKSPSSPSTKNTKKDK